jgi:hypothetical protein
LAADFTSLSNFGQASGSKSRFATSGLIGLGFFVFGLGAFVMEVAAFECPLTDDQLRELGRLALNFGYAEFLLDATLSRLLQVEGKAKKALIAPLTTRRKIELIEENLGQIADEAAIEHIKRACKTIDQANGDRNQLIHGYWAFHVDKETKEIQPASNSKKPSRQKLSPERLATLADAIAVATRDLYAGEMICAGHKPGSFRYPVRLYAGKGPPPDWLPGSLAHTV